MREAGLTKQERGLLTLTRVLLVLFFLATILFIILPTWSLNYLSDLGQVVFGFKTQAIELEAHKFWLVLAVGYTAVLTYACFIAQSDFLRLMDYLKIVIFGKFVTASGFIFCFLKYDYVFYYLVGAVIDSLLFFITLYCYHAAKKSRSG
ncbi:MAG: hypothetical protein ABH859_08370 [Pseudomonadota bacterium]